ncbi:glycerophosphodiester phosphodiesterase [Massilia sp. KIM]|uniref:glycerophosphodiester phosphodiesterase n=1 Tax=Massilia sp. KIM TaxID=1955422 RepID=UPI0009D325C3|nr:glycerophosphodiester phosphodiesterase [Massilia sp. KIM]OON60862.1 glycerophosphodiester phosphodiesterase [Massilia sp. KIM]
MQQTVFPSFLRLVPLVAAVFIAGCGGDDDGRDLLNPGAAWPPVPTVTGHRGASAVRPEHTLAAYQKAIEDGADIVEPDLVATKDGVLVARHENEISGTTNVSTLSQFASRKTTKTIDGVAVTGWFTEDFTLAELKTLRARERIPNNRPANVSFNDQFEIPTLQEVIDLVRRESEARNKTIGLYPETKHPTYFKNIGLPLEKRLVDTLVANGYKGKNAAVYIQSFETANLKELRGMTDMRLVQLLDSPTNAPYDFVAARNGRTYADLITPAGLKEIAAYADVVSPYKEIIIPRTSANELGAPTQFVANARAAGLKVHTWTLRPENPFLPVSLRAAPVTSLSQRGNAVAEITAYLNAGIDGFFTDDPASGRAAVNAFTRK